MSNVEVKLEGTRPSHPRDKVLACEGFLRALCDDPAEGVMLCLTVAVFICDKHSDKPPEDELKQLAAHLFWARKAVDELFPAKPDAETLQ